ncbi:MAG TPA: VOC family protein [Pseudonocardia sp.]|jgi:predicted enzyme related to lactoylglutathione lyase|nr:VOC family protein [Pseudonocardia sp.]
MELVSIRIITDDVARLVAFYEQATGATAIWGNEVFAELPTASGTLAVADTRTVPLFGSGAAEPGANRSVIIEYLVDDVDASYEKLRGLVERVVTEPTTMPWGNRALLLRDPDGNLVNFFTPVTPQARAKFGR